MSRKIFGEIIISDLILMSILVLEMCSRVVVKEDVFFNWCRINLGMMRRERG